MPEIRASTRNAFAAAMACLVTLLGGVGVASCASGSSTRSTSSSSTRGTAGPLSVAASSSARPLPGGFLGLSFEFRGLEEYAGTDPAALDQPFLALVRNLAPGQNPVLRIGGDSTDWTWWPVAGTSRPGGVAYNLDSNWARVARAVAGALGARLILGVNFEADSRKIAKTMADQMVKRIGAGSIEALELGNEPELYASFGWYKDRSGHEVPGRPPSYDFGAYLDDYAGVASVLPGVRLAGPSSGSPIYLNHLGQFLDHERRVGLVTIHAYPLKYCVPSERPSITQLLAPSTASSVAAQTGAYAAIAHRHSLALRVDEMNSVSCGGYRPVSYSFGAALWALDQLFELDRAGVDGVNFDTIPNTIQHLIGVSESAGRWSTTVEPEYYGLLAFAQAAPAGSRLVPIAGRIPAGVRAYATLAPGGQVHVVLINTSSAARSVVLRLPGGASSVTLTRLTAPSLGSTTGVTLGGQAINSATGELAGTSTATTVSPSGGTYAVSIPGGTAALLSTG